MKLWRNVGIAAVVVGVLIGLAFMQAARREAVAQQAQVLRSEMRQMLGEYRTAIAAGRPIPKPRPSAAGGDVGVLGDTVFAVYYGMGHEAESYQATVRRLCTSSLQPAALGARGGLDAAHKAIAECRAAAVRYRDTATAMLNGMPAKVEQLKIDSGLRREVMDGMSGALGVGQSNLAAIFAKELSIYDELDSYVTWLGEVRGHWRPQGGMMAFDRPGDLSEFNRRMAEVARLNREIEQMKASQMAQFERSAR